MSLRISLEEWIRDKVNHLESVQEYSVSTDSIRCWIDEYDAFVNKILDGNFFYEKPQEREIEGMIEYEVSGNKYIDKKVYSIPCEQCIKCPVYKIDEDVVPTTYYCQAGFLFGIFNKAINENTIPENCRISEVNVAKNLKRS